MLPRCSGRSCCGALGDPRALLADVLACIADHPAKRLDELMPWNWRDARLQQAAA